MAEARRPSRQVRRAEARKTRSASTAWRAERLAAPLLVVAGLIAYHNAFNGPFVLDDLKAIPSNSTIRTLWPPWSVLSPPVQSPVAGRPLVNLSLALNYAFDGLEVPSYHAFNLAIHLFAALVLFGIIRRTLRGPRMEGRYRKEATGVATVVALLWVVHPLTTESVDYTIQRTELLMGLFFLLTLYCAIRGFASPHRWGWYAAAAASFALGMGSKEVIVVAPVLVLVYDWLFDSSSLRDALKRHWRLYAGFAGVLVLSVLLVATRFRRVFAGVVGRALTPWDYAKTECGVIVHYLRLALWPHPLAADYDGWPIATSVTSILPSLIVVVTLVALTLWGLGRRRMLAFLGVWFFLILAPTSSFKPIIAEVAAERRMYLPLAAIIVLLVLGGRELLRWLAAPPTAAIGITVVLGATLAVATMRRNDDYRTTLSFWSDIVAKRPDNPRARLWLGKYFHEAGRSAEAFSQLAEAVRLRPRDAQAQHGFGVVLASLGRTEEAVEHYREALRIDPSYPNAHNNLGVALTNLGEVDEAIEHYREAVRIDPGHLNAHYNLAVALGQRGQTEEAIEHLETVVRLKPDFTQARQTLDDLRSRAGQ